MCVCLKINRKGRTSDKPRENGRVFMTKMRFLRRPRDYPWVGGDFVAFLEMLSHLTRVRKLVKNGSFSTLGHSCFWSRYMTCHESKPCDICYN